MLFEEIPQDEELEILSISPNKWTDPNGTEWIFQ